MVTDAFAIIYSARQIQPGQGFNIEFGAESTIRIGGLRHIGNGYRHAMQKISPIKGIGQMGITIEFTDTKGDMIRPERLLPPELRQLRAIRAVIFIDAQQIADVFIRQAAPMNILKLKIKLTARPESQFFSIQSQPQIEGPAIGFCFVDILPTLKVL